MAAKNKALGSRIIFDRPFNHERQFESGALPGNPNDFSTKFSVELIQFSPSVGARRQCDGPVGVQMVHMGEGKEGMQWSVDGCRHPILSECRKRVVADHLIFVWFPAIELLELFQAIEAEQGKSSFADGAEISATAFYRQYAHRAASKQIGKLNFGAGV